MAHYVFDCEKCEVSWEISVPMSKMPKTSKCPKCKAKREKTISTPYIQFLGADWESNSKRQRNFREKGFDKDTTKEFLENSIEMSKDSMKKMGSSYTRFEPNLENLEKSGKVTKVSDKRAAEKIDTSRKLTAEHYNKAGLKPGWREE